VVYPKGVAFIHATRPDGTKMKIITVRCKDADAAGVDELVRTKLASVPRSSADAVTTAAPASAATIDHSGLDADEPRRSKRPKLDARAEAFSPSKGWSEYERERAGERHARTRDCTYSELRDFSIRVRPLIAKLASRPDNLSKQDVEAVVEAMQLAAAELIDEGVIGGDDDAQAAQAAEPTADAAFEPMDVVGGAPRPLQADAARACVQPRFGLRVEPDEADIEGGVWLALMNGKSFSLTQAELHAGQLV